MYHHVEDPVSMKFSVTPDRFQAQMALLDRLGVQSWLPGGTIDPNAGSP